MKDQVTSAKSILLLLPPEPDTDSLAAALGLHLSFQAVGKKSLVGCSSDVKVADSHLFGIDQVKKNIGRRNLVVSFPYQAGSVENVSYDIDEEKGQFNLRIKPTATGQSLDVNQMSFSYTGASADLVIVVGVNTLEELGSLYSEEKNFLDQSQVSFLNPTPAKPAVSLAELASHLLQQSGINPTADAATNLYRQICQKSDNFSSPSVTADTFETVAFLLRSGAQKSTPDHFLGGSPPPPPPVGFPASSNQVPPDWQGPKIFRSTNTSK